MEETTNAAQDNTTAADSTTQTTETTVETTEQTAEANASDPAKLAEQALESAKRAEQAAEEEQKSTIPDKYEPPTLPDGFTMNEELMAKGMEFAKENGWTQEQYQKGSEFFTEATKDLGARILEDINNQCTANYDEVVGEIKADKQSGKDFDKNVGHVNAMLTKYGATGEQLHTALTALAGFDKEAVKPFFSALTKIAQDWADPTTILASQKAQEHTFYPGLPRGAKFR